MNTDLKRLPTPAVVVDLDQAERNIKKMAEEAGKYGIRHRPHIKTHRSGYLAELQIKAGCFYRLSDYRGGQDQAAAGFRRTGERFYHYK